MGCAEALKNAVKYAIPGAATAYAIKGAVSRWEEQTCPYISPSEVNALVDVETLRTTSQVKHSIWVRKDSLRRKLSLAPAYRKPSIVTSFKANKGMFGSNSNWRGRIWMPVKINCEVEKCRKQLYMVRIFMYRAVSS